MFMDEVLGSDGEIPDYEPPADIAGDADVIDIEHELITMGFIPVPDEFGNTNWINPNKLNNGELPTDS